MSLAPVPFEADDASLRVLASLGDSLAVPSITARQPLGQLVEDASTGSRFLRPAPHAGAECLRPDRGSTPRPTLVRPRGPLDHRGPHRHPRRREQPGRGCGGLRVV